MSMGADGKYYKLLDSRDWSRYQVLSDEEVKEEIRRSTQTKENMMTLTGKFKDGHYKEKTGIKFLPPQMGTASKSRKIEKKAWEKDMLAASTNQMGTKRMNDPDSEYAQTIRALQANTEVEDDGHIEPQTFEFDPRDGPEDRVGRAFNVIQKKYEQNLHVVERLYEEKMSLEEYARHLERELQRSRSRPSAIRSQSPDDHNAIETRDYRFRSSAALAPPKYDEVADIDREVSGNQRRGRSRDPLNQTAPAGSVYDRGLRSHSAPRHSYTLPHRGDEGQLPEEETDRGHEHRRSRSTGRASVARSSSASRRRPDGVAVSSNLLADADRYVQKRRMLEEKERLEKLEEEKYLLELKEKQLRASMNGKSFDEMFRRQEEAKKKNEDKKKKEQLLELEKKRKEREELAKKKKEKEYLMATAIGTGTSWQEAQQLEEQRRKERIERRKQELLMISALPQSIEENLNRANSKKATLTMEQEAAAMQAKANSQFRADDPAKVRARLEKKQRAWEQALERKKEELKEESLAKSRRGSKESVPVAHKLPIEIRNEEYKARREARKKEQEEKEQRELAKKKAEEKAKRDKILNTKLPEASLKETIAHKKRLEKLKKEREAEEEARKKEAAKERRKQIEMKEAAALLSMAIKDRDEQLRQTNDHYELRATDQMAHEAAVRAREEYRAKLRENKRRIQESLKNRKSLLQRHDEDMAKKTAVTTALKKVAKTVHDVGETVGNDDEDDLDAILSGSKSRKNSTGNSTMKSTASKLEDEIFSTKEKMIVGDV